VLGCGAALFLAGDAIIRTQLRAGPVRVRAAAAVAALATAVVGTFAGLNAQLVLVAAVLIVPLMAEQEARTADGAAGEAAGAAGGGDAAG
jgi:hypothetical protein